MAHVRIDGDPEQVTGASGSSGGIVFAMLVTFNLTEFDEIDSVYFVNEGDHFEEGEASRLNFWRFMSDEDKLSHKQLLDDGLNAKDEKVHMKIEKLAEIGDEKTIGKLRRLKQQTDNVGYSNSRMTEREFKTSIDEAIAEIENRLKKKKK
jgi:hypothetical protein